MNQENLFRLIRKEQVVLWAGAGFSMYAGFPSGIRLAQMLYDELSDAEKNEIDPSQMLTALAQDFFRIKGGNKNALITFLKKNFIHSTPSSTEFHDKLAQLPYFKNIITTNYDKLFENAFGINCNVIHNSKHVPYQDESKVSIFKIHGDLSDPDSIIITTDDYNKFFSSNAENTVFWNTIKERLSSKVILFLGYNLEDPNIAVLFDKVCNELGENRKECFFIAPNVKKLKQDDLIRKNILYIDSTGERFIEEFLEDIKKNVISDLHSGSTSPESFRKFLLTQDILPTLKANKNSYRLIGLQGINKELQGTIKIKLKENDSFHNEMKEFTEGRKFGEFQVSKDKLKNVDVDYGGLKIPEEELDNLKFISRPKIDSKINLSFEDEFEIEDIPMKFYISKHKLQVELDFICAQITAVGDLESFRTGKPNIKYEILHEEVYNTTSEGLRLFNFLKRISTGTKFSAYNNEGNLITQQLSLKNDMQGMELYYDYLNTLKALEQHLKLKFRNIEFDSINNHNLNIIQTILIAVLGQRIDYGNEGSIEISIKNLEKDFNKLKIGQDLDSPFVFATNIKEQVKIYNHSIQVGGKIIEILSPYISDIIPISTTEAKIILKSRENIINVTYGEIADGDLPKIVNFD